MMNMRYWLTGAAGAATLAATLAFAPLTSAQQATPPTASAVMNGTGHGRGGQGGTGGTGTCTGTNFVDADGDGVCDNAGTGAGAGTGFVDADGDGVCDNMGTGTGTGTGQGRGGQGRGRP
jgi:hypothetical protein